ncbi:MAG TPA: response regulator [Vicinamibacterales bacterium]|nr:response regulator [Vicinamibacterales bacterium]
MSRHSDPVQRPGRTVLLVEDDADTREMYRMALEAAGYRVAHASNVHGAMSAVSEHRPDVIVTDLGLPGGLDGLQLADGLERDPHTAGIPLLALTGRDPQALGERAARFAAVLTKPVLPDVLVSRVRDSLS